MRAIAVYPGQKDSVHLREADNPEIDDNEVLVRTIYAGVCGTDLEINEGLYGTAPRGSDYLIAGHESLGIIERVGRNVTNLSEGEYVARTVRRPCSDCTSCNAGSNDMCSTGNFTEVGIAGIHGVMAEYFKDLPNYLVRIPRQFKDIGVLLEPLSVVEKGTRRAFEIQKGFFWNLERALVIGAGPIGILQAMILRSEEIETYVLARSERGNNKSRLIEEIGAKYISANEYYINPTERFDFIVEASGDSEMAFQAMELLRANGILCLTSVTGGKKEIIVPADKINLGYVLGNKSMFGTVNANIQDYEQGVEKLKMFERKWPGLTKRLITRKIPVSRFKEGFVKGREDIKTVIEF